VRVLSRLFRRLILEGLTALHEAGRLATKIAAVVSAFLQSRVGPSKAFM